MKLKPERWKQTQLMFLVALILIFLMDIRIETSPQLGLLVHNIATGIDYATMQDAVDAPETLDGHTILVDQGVYYEHVIVDKAVRLVGEGQTKTIVDGEGAEEVVSLKKSGAEIAGFTVQNGSWGIALRYIRNSSVTANKVVNCSYGGIFLSNCSKCKVANNTVASTSNAGVYLWESVGNHITNNAFANTSHGIYLLVYSTDNVISNNSLANNPQGVAFSYNCGNNTLEGNTVTSSNVGGIVMGGAQNNTIYHNNVLHSAKPAWSYGNSSNSWDNGAEGNFWDSYLGTDLNRDGVGDTPFEIDENNLDNHPLMGIFYDFDVSWQKEIFSVNVISNSTVSGFDFKVADKPEVRKTIEFNVTGEDNVYGFCRVMVPTTLMNYSYTVLINGEQVEITVLDISNSTHAYIYFAYNTSSKRVVIVSELPSVFGLSLLVCLTTLIVLSLKKKVEVKPQKSSSKERAYQNSKHPCVTTYIIHKFRFNNAYTYIFTTYIFTSLVLITYIFLSLGKA